MSYRDCPCPAPKEMLKWGRKKTTKPWSFALLLPLSTKGRGVGGRQQGRVHLAFPTENPKRVQRVCLDKTPDGLVPELGRTSPSRNKGLRSGPPSGDTHFSPTGTQRGERAQAPRAGTENALLPKIVGHNFVCGRLSLRSVVLQPLGSS